MSSTEKIQMEDDITASVLVPGGRLPYLDPEYSNGSLKFVSNCEYRFFQRPDDAVIKGFDHQAEKDLSGTNLFVTNYQPLTKKDVSAIKDDIQGFISYTEPVRKHIDEFLNGDDNYCIVSSEPRLVHGAPSKNPRYLELRADFVAPVKTYVAEVGTRLSKRISLDQPVLTPVNCVLPGRRNNPPEMENGRKLLPLSVYNPIHYQELPELFMDFISCRTGKSPSTTGAGSEGALTKGPFNMLLPVYDLNSALLSYILGDYAAFTTPAGHIGSDTRIDHDISILVPELWSRLTEAERKPSKLIAEGSLEKLEDFVYNGVNIPASRLGYRITDVFCFKYFGKIFDEPQSVFTQEILQPEKQSLEAFADGVLNIANGHKKAALNYFKDGSIDEAISPIKALLHIMAYGDFEGHTLESGEVRGLFRKEYVLSSDWYAKRLKNKQRYDISLLEKKIENLRVFISNPVNKSVIREFGYDERLAQAEKAVEYCRSDAYLASLNGTIGAESMSLA